MNQQLQDRINELVRNGDAPSLIWMFEGQLRITDLAYARIAELEATYAPLPEQKGEHDCDKGFDPNCWRCVGAENPRS